MKAGVRQLTKSTRRENALRHEAPRPPSFDRIAATLALIRAGTFGFALLALPAVSQTNQHFSPAAAKHANAARFYAAAHKHAPTMVEIKIAAEQGDPEAQNNLADICSAQLDFGTAIRWYRKSAEAGCTNAQFHLGELLLNGCPGNANSLKPLRPNLEEALVWLGRAANSGHPGAQLDLGACYRDGTGVAEDPLEAFKWFALVAKQTNSAAQSALDRLSLRLRSDEIAAGQQRADTFVPGKETRLPEPAYLKQLKLEGISGVPTRRLAIVNNRTMERSEEIHLTLDNRSVPVRCLEIRDKSVVLQIGPFTKEVGLNN